MKKALISLLVLAMCLGFGSAVFSAAGDIAPAAYSDIAGHEAEADLTLLAAMGYLPQGAELAGAAKPDDPMTRAAFVKLLVQAMGRGSTALGLMGLEPTFADGASIPTWAWGYVNAAVYMGIINGYPGTVFGANGPVSYAEAVTMLVRAIPGHLAQVPAGVWPYNFLFYGVDTGFTGSVDVGFASLPATTGDLARMLVATMQVPKLKADGTAIADSAILFDRVVPPDGKGTSHVGRLYRGLFENYALAPMDVFGVVIYYSEEDIWFEMTLADPVYLVGGKTYDEFNNLPVWAVVDAKGALMFVAKDESSTVVTGTLADLISTGEGEPDTSDYWDTIVLTDGTKVPYAHEGEGSQVWTMVNHMGPLPLYVLDRIVASPEFLPTIPNPFLPPELVITLGPDGLATAVIATTFTESTWIAEFTESSVEPDGTKVDANVLPYLGRWETDEWTLFGSFDIPASCRVELNGALTGRDLLAENDVISVAFDFNSLFEEFLGGDGIDGGLIDGGGGLDGDGGFLLPSPEPYIVRAHREPIEGTVTGTSLSYGASAPPVFRATLKDAAGESKTYVVDQAGGIDGTLPHWPLPDAVTNNVVKYGLDFAGNIFVPIGYETLTPYVVCRSYTETGDGKFSATFDVRGVEKTYALDVEMPDVEGDPFWVGRYVYIEVNSGTGIVDVDASHVLGPDWACEVLAVDAANGTLTIDGESGVEFFDDPALVVYEVNDAGEKVYVGLEGLAAGDWVLWDFAGEYPVFEVTEEPLKG